MMAFYGVSEKRWSLKIGVFYYPIAFNTYWGCKLGQGSLVFYYPIAFYALKLKPMQLRLNLYQYLKISSFFSLVLFGVAKT